jgi:hypothetical protein
MGIEELAKRKTELKLTLQAISQCNVYGKTVSELTELEIQQINARKELHDVQAKIDAYIQTA